jgi:hypothetical protein
LIRNSNGFYEYADKEFLRINKETLRGRIERASDSEVCHHQQLEFWNLDCNGESKTKKQCARESADGDAVSGGEEQAVLYVDPLYNMHRNCGSERQTVALIGTSIVRRDLLQVTSV